MRNTGKPSEDVFESRLRGNGKRCKVIRFEDAADLFARNERKKLNTSSKPADFIVVLNGDTFFAEVKSTTNKARFPFGMIERDQWASAVMITAAGGLYFIFVHSLQLSQWFKIPFASIATWKDQGMASATWAQLTPYQWI